MDVVCIYMRGMKCAGSFFIYSNKKALGLGQGLAGIVPKQQRLEAEEDRALKLFFYKCAGRF
ncbi:hypothetical protein D3C78_57080 [compost metagenome]